MKRRFAMLSLVCLLAVGAGAKKEYPLSLQVESEANMESQHPSFRFGFHSWGGGSSGGGFFGHTVAKHIYAVGTDHNAYDFVPKDARDFIVPGIYPARFEKHDVVALVNGREIKLVIVEVKTVETK